MALTRRRVLVFSSTALVLPTIATPKIGDPQKLDDALKSSLVYLSPLKADGSESKCHGEVWFVVHDGSLYVSTASNAWRAEAIRKELNLARLWLGEHGVWTKAKDSFKSSPSFVAKAELTTDKQIHAAALEKFGKKYPERWDTWGPRFAKGLEDGSRVLIKYSRLENGAKIPLK